MVILSKQWTSRSEVHFALNDTGQAAIRPPSEDSSTMQPASTTGGRSRLCHGWSAIGKLATQRKNEAHKPGVKCRNVINMIEAGAAKKKQSATWST